MLRCGKLSNFCPDYSAVQKLLTRWSGVAEIFSTFATRDVGMDSPDEVLAHRGYAFHEALSNALGHGWACSCPP